MIADSLDPAATIVFDATATATIVRLCDGGVGAFAHASQIYFDFSRYSDMAIGLGWLFEIRLPFDFDAPYRAVDMIDFWRRWHTTLSRFPRDYLYVPLGGRRRGKIRRYFNLMLTMLLGGLWHGTAWTFAAWGGLHGVYLILTHVWRSLVGARRVGRGDASKILRCVSIAATNVAVTAAWVIFCSDSFAAAFSMLLGMSGLRGIGIGNLSSLRSATAALPLLFLWVWLLPTVQQMFGRYLPRLQTDEEEISVSGRVSELHERLRWRPTVRWAAGVSIAAVAAIAQLTKVRKFIYCQF